MNKANLIRSSVIKFMIAIQKCHENTEFANDRPHYEKDLMVTARWLSKLNAVVDTSILTEEIISLNTEKYFTDCWKEGSWAEYEIASFLELKKEILDISA